MMEWLAMGGYGFYIWSSYGMMLLAILIELAWLRQRRRSAREAVDMAQEETFE